MMTRDDLLLLLEAHKNDATLPDFDLFVEIALRESRGDPLAWHVNKNGTVDRGLWQINSVHEKLVPILADNFRLACYTPSLNCMLALAVYRMQGYHAWVSFNDLP